MPVVYGWKSTFLDHFEVVVPRYDHDIFLAQTKFGKQFSEEVLHFVEIFYYAL